MVQSRVAVSVAHYGAEAGGKAVAEDAAGARAAFHVPAPLCSTSLLARHKRSPHLALPAQTVPYR